MYYDVKKLKEAVNPFSVVQYLGIPYRRSGKNIFIRCPDHEERTGEEDRNISNCVLGKDWYGAYYCFACGAKGSLIHLVARVCDLDEKADFAKILILLAESCGNTQDFLMENPVPTYSKEEEKENPNPEKGKITGLTNKQLEEIGLFSSVYSSNVTEVFSHQNPDNEDLTIETDWSHLDSNGLPETLFLEKKGSAYSLSQLAKEYPDVYSEIVQSQMEEKLSSYQSVFSSLSGKQEFQEEIREKLQQKMLEILSIQKEWNKEKESV